MADTILQVTFLLYEDKWGVQKKSHRSSLVANLTHKKTEVPRPMFYIYRVSSTLRFLLRRVDYRVKPSITSDKTRRWWVCKILLLKRIQKWNKSVGKSWDEKGRQIWRIKEGQKKKRRREGYTQKRKENNEGLWIWVGGYRRGWERVKKGTLKKKKLRRKGTW